MEIKTSPIKFTSGFHRKLSICKAEWGYSSFELMISNLLDQELIGIKKRNQKKQNIKPIENMGSENASQLLNDKKDEINPFEKEFPGLKGVFWERQPLGMIKDAIRIKCLDKQRVKDALDKFTFKHNAEESNVFKSHEINDWILDLEEELGISLIDEVKNERRT